MSTYYIEVRGTVKRYNDPVFIPLEDWTKLRGYSFRSIYAYDEKSVEIFQRSRSLEGIQTHPVYSDMLFIDIDSDDKNHIEYAYNKLADLNIYFEAWSTGRRGIHFHVPITPMFGVKVPNSQVEYVKYLFPKLIEEEAIDLSFYCHTGQYRLPGAVHSKTVGGVKTLKYRVNGHDVLNIPLIDEVPVSKYTGTVVDTTREAYIANLTRYRDAGGRHLHLMILVKDGIALGLDLNTVIHDAKQWNKRWARVPLDESLLEEHVIKTYRQFGG